MSQTWKVSIWGGHSNNTHFRTGTYGQVSASLRHLPPGYIWSVS